jgi:hypothetical protein
MLAISIDSQSVGIVFRLVYRSDRSMADSRIGPAHQRTWANCNARADNRDTRHPKYVQRLVISGYFLALSHFLVWRSLWELRGGLVRPLLGVLQSDSSRPRCRRSGAAEEFPKAVWCVHSERIAPAWANVRAG